MVHPWDMERTVAQVARLAGVSVRTLHHYDHIGLLCPRERSATGYRLYTREDLLRLQEILLLRELGMALPEIGALLDAPGRDPVAALEAHRERVAAQVDRLGRTLATIDRTIAFHRKEHTMLTDEEMYEGIAPETAKAWQAEARERWDPALVRQSEERVKRMGKEGLARVKAQGAAVIEEWARAMEADPSRPDSPAAQAAAASQLAWLRNFYEPSSEMFEGLGRMYAEDERFGVNYETRRTGLAAFIRDAMAVFARTI